MSSQVAEKSDSYSQCKAEEFAKRVHDAYSRPFIFLLVGRTGVGKSSTINSLMGTDIAEIGEFEPQTMTVQKYQLPIENVNFLIFDTPGLCDDLPESGNDLNYINQIKSKIDYVDCLLYVTFLGDTRVRQDEQRGVSLVTKAFGENLWKNSIIVFTHSDKVDKEKYQKTYQKRTELMRSAIEKQAVSSKIAQGIPSVAIDNTSETLPNGKNWLGELYATAVERISNDGFVQYIMATAPRFTEEQTKPEIIERVIEKIVYVQTPVYVEKPDFYSRDEEYAGVGILSGTQTNRIRKAMEERGYTPSVVEAGLILVGKAVEVAVEVFDGTVKAIGKAAKDTCNAAKDAWNRCWQK